MSLYRRAHVNLLIATVVGVKLHPDAAKYAQECIDLVQIVKAEGFSERPAYLDAMAAEALTVKSQIIEEVETEREAIQKSIADFENQGGLITGDFGTKLVENLVGEHGLSALGSMTIEERQPIFIEGMYSSGPFESISFHEETSNMKPTTQLSAVVEGIEPDDVNGGLASAVSDLKVGDEGYESSFLSPAQRVAQAAQTPDSGIGSSRVSVKPDMS